MRKVIPGFWFGPWQRLLQEPLDYAPSKAVLPRIGERLGAAAVCLDLVSLVDPGWFPLSEPGALTFAHSDGLLRGETWQFVVFRDGVREVYDARLDKPITVSRVGDLYGKTIQKRCRSGRKYVQIRLTRA